MPAKPALALLILLGLAYALTPELSPTDIRQAVSAGEAIGNQHQGYAFGDYVLYGKENGLVIRPGQSEVEAVILGTPYERLRWTSYLLTSQRKKVTQQAIDAEVSRGKDRVRFVVFAHSQSNKDQNFLEKFGPAKVTGDFGSVSVSRVERSGPSLDLYTVVDSSGNRRVETRWLGTVTYIFDLGELEQKANADVTQLSGELVFADGTGKEYKIPFDFGKAR